MRWPPTGSIRGGATRRRRSGPPTDPRVAALAEARKNGTDALPQLRRVHPQRLLHACCRRRIRAGQYQAGLEPRLALPAAVRPALPRSGLPHAPPHGRRPMTSLRVIDHDDASKAPQSQTIDDAAARVDAQHPRRSVARRPGRVHRPVDAAAAAEEVHDLHARAGGRRRNVVPRRPTSPASSRSCSIRKFSGVATNAMLRVFRRAKDLEHMIRDRSWRDLWSLVEDMRKKGSAVQTAGARVRRRAPQLLHDRQPVRQRPGRGPRSCRSPVPDSRRRSAGTPSRGWPSSSRACRSTSARGGWCPAS